MGEASRLERLLDETEIKSILVRERYYRDTKQWKKLRDCYHPDASKTSINVTWYRGDIDGFVAGSEKMVQRGKASSAHTVCPVEVHLQRNKAVSESTGTILARFKHHDTAYDCVSQGRFISRLARVAGEWKLVSLEVIYDRDAIQPVVPGEQCHSLKLDMNARESYRCLSWVLAENGFAINQELPGTDIPGSEAELMGSCFEWLQEEE